MFFCLLCHDRSPAHSDVCPACESDLPWLHHSCRTCAEPLADIRDSLCLRCQRDLPATDHCIAPFQYRFPLDQLILAMKQQPRPELLGCLSRWLSQHLAQQRHPLPDLLLPVPMHASRQIARGFNQAGILAHRLGRDLGIPVRQDLLLKRKATVEQKTLSREQRQRNLANAFKLERVTLLKMQPRPRHIALVDDVITTGTTTAQLAALLKKSGIARVDVWALAKTPLQAV
jgi:ComF family protein